MTNMKGAVECSTAGRCCAMWKVGATSTRSTASSSICTPSASTFFLSVR